MNKDEYIDYLFHNLKDNIEFDSDIVALKKLLIATLKIDPQKAQERWLYLLTTYKINELSQDIDFSPLLNDFPTCLIEQEGIKTFFELIKVLNNETKLSIYKSFFNIYNKDCGIYNVLHNLIQNNKTNKEREYIKLVVKRNNEYPSGIFDIKDFLQNIIIYHLETNHKDIKFLLEISEIPQSIKEQSLLKTLLIDYI